VEYPFKDDGTLEPKVAYNNTSSLQHYNAQQLYLFTGDK